MRAIIIDKKTPQWSASEASSYSGRLGKLARQCWNQDSTGRPSMDNVEEEVKLLKSLLRLEDAYLLFIIGRVLTQTPGDFSRYREAVPVEDQTAPKDVLRSFARFCRDESKRNPILRFISKTLIIFIFWYVMANF